MSQCWTKVQIKGNKPAPRRYHSTLCIEDPHTGDHPLLMVVGGLGVGYSVLSDVWLLDVINGVWAEVCVHFLTSTFTSTCTCIFQMYMYVYTYTVKCMAIILGKCIVYGIVCGTL